MRAPFYPTPAQKRLIAAIESEDCTNINQLDGNARRTVHSLIRHGAIELSEDGDLILCPIIESAMPVDWDNIPHPALVVLNYSGGRQSAALLWMVLLGLIEVPKDRFVVMNADPGMENSNTYKYNEMMYARCEEADIRVVVAEGPNLYKDLINLSKTKNTRIDNPPYWLGGKPGQHGRRLNHKCTKVYKIDPMAQATRKLLYEMYDINPTHSKMPKGLVERWLGFSYSEVGRIKPPSRNYVRFRYPLIELKYHDEDVMAFYEQYNLPIPERSVCNACFANGLRYLYDMYHQRPADWKQAVEVDRAIRDWSQVGVNEPVYVSHSLIPLETLEVRFGEEGPNLTDGQLQNIVQTEYGDTNLEEDFSCDSGYCFL